MKLTDSKSNINFFRRYFMVRICVRIVKCFQVKCIMAWHDILVKFQLLAKTNPDECWKQWKGMRTLRLSNRSIFIAETSDIPDLREFYKNDMKPLENTEQHGAWSPVRGFLQNRNKNGLRVASTDQYQWSQALGPAR